MASKEEWCAEKLSKLLNEDLRISTLTEIKEHFQEISNSEAALTAELLELPLVFDCLNDSNKEQVDLACEVLSFCMEKLDIAETTARYSIPLERALIHPNPGVKLMALDEISRIIKCDAVRKQQLVNDLSKRLLLTNIIKCVGDDDLKVASAAGALLTCFATVSVDCILTSQLIKIIKETMGFNEVVRLRFYELLIDICVLNKESHNKIVSTGLLSPIMHEIHCKDILLCMNIIELLRKLVECDYGYEYLQSEGFMDKLFKQFSEEHDPIFLQLCEPGILKFFGHMAHCKPNDVFNKYQQVVDRIFINLESSNYTIFKVSLETIGYISSADKSILDNFVGNKMTSAIKSISERLQTLPTKEKVTSLAWIEELLKNPSNENNSQIALKWYRMFGSNPMDLIMHYVRNPFQELRLAGLGVLFSLTMHKWGQEAIKNYPGLIEFLMDRSAETFKDARDQKYFIVKNIYDSNFDVFDHGIMTQLLGFIKEGPHYVNVMTEVAIEGND